jgi:hypothetical protein
MGLPSISVPKVLVGALRPGRSCPSHDSRGVSLERMQATIKVGH